MKPRLLGHYRVQVRPDDGSGLETLVFASEGKRVVLEGQEFPTFVERVVPLLDGRHDLEEIKRSVEDVFEPDDLTACLSLLLENRVVEDAELVALPSRAEEQLAPQLSYFREIGLDPGEALDRLARSKVSVVGLGAVGAVSASALAASNVGNVRCIDGSAVSSVDPLLAQVFGRDDVGRLRAEVTRERILGVNAATSVEVLVEELRSDEDVAAAVAGSDFVLGCLDPGLVWMTNKLNKACLSEGIPWSTGTVSAFEGIVGPTVIPGDTACYLCYQMRSSACDDDPEAALAELEERDRNRTDGSLSRENLAFGAGIVGNMLALEAFKALLGTVPATAGRILTLDLAACTTRLRVVLRHPSCPACFGVAEA